MPAFIQCNPCLKDPSPRPEDNGAVKPLAVTKIFCRANDHRNLIQFATLTVFARARVASLLDICTDESKFRKEAQCFAVYIPFPDN